MAENQPMRLDILQRIHEVLIQLYELHKYPNPRLFIVLPEAGGVQDGPGRPTPQQYRLYFLCECHARTTSGDNETKHEIHLAKHEGYDLVMPTSFFRKYGSYILMMMYMIKHGVTTLDTVLVPSKILDELKSTLGTSEDGIIALVNDTIKFLDGIRRDNGSRPEPNADSTGSNELEDLNEVDIDQLRCFLKVRNDERSLGNLYRIITSNGHVKWVCHEHYKTYHGDPLIQYLGSKFVEVTGRIEVTIGSDQTLNEFCIAIVKARVVQELKVLFVWNASKDQLRKFANAVAGANVARLEVDGSHLIRGFDFVNRGRRFNPILKLPSKSQVRSLHLVGFVDLFSRVKSLTPKPSPNLREFSLDSEFPISEKTKSFSNLLDRFHALAILELRLHDMYLLTEVASEILDKLHDLESFTLKFDRFDITANVSHQVVQDACLTIDKLDQLKDDDRQFLQQGHFTQLDVQHSKRHTSRKSRYTRGSRVQSTGKRGLSVVATTRMELQSLTDFALSEEFRELETMSINYPTLSLEANISQGKVQRMAMTIDRLCNLGPRDVAFIQDGPLTHLAIQYTPREEDTGRLNTILQSRTLTKLIIGCGGNRAPAIIARVIAAVLDEGEAPSLRSFKLMEEKLVPFDEYGECDDSNHIEAHVSFESRPNFRMRTWIRLRNSTILTDTRDHIYSFAQQYGWSFVFVEEGQTRNNTFADILDRIPDSSQSPWPTQLETLSFDGTKFSANDITRLNSITQRFPELRKLGLRMRITNDHHDSQFELLRQHGSKLFKLHLYGTSTAYWLSKIPDLQTRSCFPNLVSFGVCLGIHCKVPLEWIMAMVSDPAQDPASSLSLQTPNDSLESTGGGSGSMTCTRIRNLVLCDIKLQPDEWMSVIEDMDVTGLTRLDLGASDIPRDLLNLLVSRIRGYVVSDVPPKASCVNHMGLHADNPTLESMPAEDPEKALAQVIISAWNIEASQGQSDKAGLCRHRRGRCR